MKKALIYALALALALSLTACSQPKAEQPTDPAPSTSAPEPIATPEPIKDTTPEPEPEQTPATPVETEDTQPPEETEPQEAEQVQLFTDCNETVYATGTVNIRSSWSAESEKLGSLNKGDSVTRTGTAITGTEAEGWSRVELSDGTVAYISSKYLSTTKPVVQQQQQQQTSKPSGGTTTQQQQQTQQPSGDTSSLPGIDLPSGTPITGGSSSQAQQPSGINNQYIGDRTDPDFIENVTKGAFGGDFSGGHVISWEEYYGNQP